MQNPTNYIYICNRRPFSAQKRTNPNALQKKKKKRITILLLAACIGTSARLAAAPRGEQAARHIAEQFLKGQAVAGKRASATDRLTLAATSADLATAKKRSATIAWYVFNQGTEAFVIVSGDDRMTDILGYSTERAFDTEGIPDNLRAWLASYTTLAENVTTSQAPGMPATRTSTDGYPETVTPLLGDINYSQDEPYNRQCPLWNETRCITGCGATAMATIDAALHYAKSGFDGIIHVKSAGCTPEIDAIPALQNISADYHVPILYLSFDTQTSETGLNTRLEAFYDMISMRKQARKWE